MEFLRVLLWMHVSGTEKEKGGGKRKAGQESKKRTERICVHFFFFASRYELAFVVLQAGTTCCAHTINKGLVAQTY